MAGIVLQKMLIMVFIMLMGFGCAKAGWIDDRFSQQASRLVLNIFLVGSILSSVVNVEMSVTNGELALCVVLSFVMFFIGAILGWIAAPLLPFEEGDRTVSWLSVFFMNNVFIGYPVVESIFGQSGIFFASLTNLPFNMLLYTLGITKLRGGTGRIRFREILSTPLIATLIAVSVFLFQIPVPKLAGDLLTALAAATVPVSMLVVGTSLSHVPIKEAFLDWKAVTMCLVMLILCPMAAWWVLKFFLPVGSMALGVLTVIAGCPSAAMITILSVRLGGDGRLASKINFLSTILCAGTLPLIIYFLL